MSLATEFREFALKGNVVDLAVGVVIGVAFGRIITSLVDDMLMPVRCVIVERHREHAPNAHRRR